jgi:hypothetical protein
VTLKDGKLLRITPQLKAALPFAAQQCRSDYLWIDQICIDQDDRDERGDQVKIMGQIYSSCSRVLIWLGRIDADLSFNDELAQGCSSEGMPAQKIPAMRHLLDRLRKVTGSSEDSTHSLCYKILQSPWFQRAWIFQEIVLPPSALFILSSVSTFPGEERTISLSDLYMKVVRCFEYTNNSDAVLSTIREMHRRCNEQRSPHISTYLPIEQTLSSLAPRAKTSEELDRLYAFFGLNDDPNVILTPSYSSSLEVALMATATSIIEGSSGLDIFEVIPRDKQRTTYKLSIPTWTPDFREEQLVLPFSRSKTADFRKLAGEAPQLWPLFIESTYTYYRGTIYCAGEEKRTIQAHGYVLDQVEIEMSTLSSRTSLEVLLQRSNKAWNKIKSNAERREPSASKFKQSNTGLATSTVDLGFAPQPTMERLRHALEAQGYCETNEEHPLHSITEDISSTMLQVMHGRTLWMTRSGRFASGSYLHRGDHICFLYGCSNPVALRGDHKTTHVFGTCFLEDWMDPWSTGVLENAEKGFERAVFYMV